jgi:hypothetical protein
MVGGWTLYGVWKSLVRRFFMKKWTGFLVFTLLLSLPMVCSAEELGGGYSMNPPDGWTVREFPGSSYKGLFGTRANNFTPNINIQEENFDGPMDQYIRLNMVQLEKLMKAEKISQSSFSTQNHDGVKLVTHTQLNDLELTQTIYFFENPSGKKVVAIATANRDSGSEYDPVFDDIMNTFQME